MNSGVTVMWNRGYWWSCGNFEKWWRPIDEHLEKSTKHVDTCLITHMYDSQTPYSTWLLHQNWTIRQLLFPSLTFLMGWIHTWLCAGQHLLPHKVLWTWLCAGGHYHIVFVTKKANQIIALETKLWFECCITTWEIRRFCRYSEQLHIKLIDHHRDGRDAASLKYGDNGAWRCTFMVLCPIVHMRALIVV